MELSIRALPLDDPTQKSLPHLIARINEQRGHFRHVTEASLEEEIRTAAAVADQDVQIIEDEAEPQISDDEARRKQVFEARAEMVKLVSQAQNEALTALDFVSLLISRDAPQQADSSMSPALKQMGMAGMLAYDKLPITKPTPAEEENARLVAVGMTCRSLQAAADALVQSANRLEKEMQREARYWEQVLSICDKGWSICRLPRDRHTLAVRLGFSEASAIFNARGLAALQPDEKGNIVLDQGLSARPKTLRVRITQPNGQTTSSRLLSVQNAAQTPIESVIRRARNSLFEEELYFELVREARSLLAHNVQIVDDTIQLNLGTAPDAPQTITIDLVDCADTVTPASTSSADSLADSIALALRLGLSAAHRRKFAKRSQPPPPLSDDKQSPPTLSILTPMVNMQRHHHATKILSAHLHTLTTALTQAHLPATTSTTIEKPSPGDLTQLLSQHSSSTALSDALIAHFSAPLITTTTFTVPPGAPLSICTTSSLSPPTYGTVFEIDETGSSTMQQYKSLLEVMRHVERHVERAVSTMIADRAPGWKVAPNRTSVLVRGAAGAARGVSVVQVRVGDGQIEVTASGEATGRGEVRRWGSKGGEDVGGDAQGGLLDVVATMMDGTE